MKLYSHLRMLWSHPTLPVTRHSPLQLLAPQKKGLFFFFFLVIVKQHLSPRVPSQLQHVDDSHSISNSFHQTSDQTTVLEFFTPNKPGKDTINTEIPVSPHAENPATSHSISTTVNSTFRGIIPSLLPEGNSHLQHDLVQKDAIR